MVRKFWHAIRPAILWGYRRGSWQYDLMVALILAFVFLTPRSWFRDQPRAQQIVMLPSENGASVFLVDPEMVTEIEPARREAQIRALLEKRTGKKVTVLKIEPAQDSEGNLRGYLASARL